MNQHDEIIRMWLAQVSSLIDPDKPDRSLSALDAMLPHLRTLSASNFTPESARRVAAAKAYGRVPSWGVIAVGAASARDGGTRCGGDGSPAAAGCDRAR